MWWALAGDLVVGEVNQTCVVGAKGCRIVGMLLCDDEDLLSRTFVVAAEGTDGVQISWQITGSNIAARSGGAAASFDTTAGDNGSVSTIITIPDASAPNTYKFPLNLPEGCVAEPQEGGSVTVDNDKGIPIGGFAVPWAKDAHGASVPASLTVEGSTLVQHVDFSADAAFPVTADPSWDLGHHRRHDLLQQGRDQNDGLGWNRGELDSESVDSVGLKRPHLRTRSTRSAAWRDDRLRAYLQSARAINASIFSCAGKQSVRSAFRSSSEPWSSTSLIVGVMPVKLHFCKWNRLRDATLQRPLERGAPLVETVENYGML